MRPASLGVALLACTAATAQEAPRHTRTPLGEAIRDVLISMPELLPPAPGLSRPPLDLYGDDIARDLDMLERAAPRLFDPARPGLGPEEAPVRIAFFTRADCATCVTARAELQALANRMGFRATLFDMERDAALARELGLDMAPSYVLPDRMLRGAMPAIVLERYLGP
ncbi:MAG: hypothetical protein U5K36_05865 [Roseovarius sp.]|nr:hypothetical protein [Roseovarius sp.]